MRELRVLVAALLALGSVGISSAQQAPSLYCYVALNTSPQLDFFSKVFTYSQGLAASNYESAFLQWTRQTYPQLPWGDTSRGPFVLDTHCVLDDNAGDVLLRRARDEQIAGNRQAGHGVIEASWPSF